jgi:hypothetical protein
MDGNDMKKITGRMKSGQEEKVILVFRGCSNLRLGTISILKDSDR